MADSSETLASGAEITAASGRRGPKATPRWGVQSVRFEGNVRQALAVVGRVSGPSIPRLLNGAANFIETGRRLKEAGIKPCRPLSSRFDVFDVAIQTATETPSPLYLEFGVWRGESIRYWSRQLPQPGARFVGFDSFEGLPERWTGRADRGAFSTRGVIPRIDDARIEFVKGWFDDTLPDFRLPDHDLLIVNVDSDLYSSAATVLDTLRPVVKLGDLLYFDEFHDRLQEGRAFHEFVASSGYKFEMIACTHGLMQVLFRRTH